MVVTLTGINCLPTTESVVNWGSVSQISKVLMELFSSQLIGYVQEIRSKTPINCCEGGVNDRSLMGGLPLEILVRVSENEE